MPTVVKVNCEICTAESELAPKGVHLYIYSSGVQYYAFFCPKCKNECRKSATDVIVSLLTQGGVAMTCVDVPEEFLEKKSGPSITNDDVMDFVKALASLVGINAEPAQVVEVPQQVKPRGRVWQGPS